MPRGGLAAALVLGVLALGGCTDADDEPGIDSTSSRPADPSLTPRQAQVTATELFDGITRALDVRGSLDGPEVVYLDGETDRCTYSGRVALEDVVLGDDVSWDDTRAAAERVARDEELTLTDQLDIPGGYNGFDAEGADGVRLEVRSKVGQPSTLQVYAPVTGTCSSEVNETLKPLGR